MTQGIETIYRGITFRSRAEARWAAFFDRCSWRWSYEPIDLAGYIPDFVLHWHRDVLVEVKGGVTSLPHLEPFVAKTEQEAWPGEVILLGASPMWRTDDELNPTLGRIAERPGGPRWTWDNCLVHRCAICDRISVHAADNSWACRVCGAYDGNRYIGGIRSGELDAMWAEACNDTMWRPAA